jgi:hypothetical protein
MGTDTTTTLYPGVGGDSMDESLVTQSDGATQAKRARVDVGADGQLTSKSNPLPVESAEAIRLLASIAEDARAIRQILELIASST